jgi:hypothetical protein
MKRFVVCIAMVLALGVSTYAQSVERKGNTFIQLSNKGSKSGGKETKTQYIFKDSKGNVYPVYLSSTGKAFIKKVSKKTGKEYKQYVPEVGKQINPEAYKSKE